MHGRSKLVLLAVQAAAAAGELLPIREIARRVRRNARTVARDLHALVREGHLVRVAYHRGFAPAPKKGTP